MISVKYGSFDLQANGVTATDTDVHSAPKKTIQSEKLAEADGSIMVKSTYESKTFTVNGNIKSPANTIVATDLLVDSFQTAMALEAQNFDVDYAGSTRRYVATPQNVIISRPKGLTSAGFSVEFFCPSSVGFDITTSTLLSPTTITTSTAQSSITVGGSYKAQPLITVTVTSKTGAGNNTVTISNGSTLRGIAITRTWTNGDVIEIDCLNQTLYVNNLVVPFSGIYPSWDPGSGSLSYLDDFSARSVSITATYTRRFM